jgi:hypothetical protein
MRWTSYPWCVPRHPPCAVLKGCDTEAGGNDLLRPTCRWGWQLMAAAACLSPVFLHLQCRCSVLLAGRVPGAVLEAAAGGICGLLGRVLRPANSAGTQITPAPLLIKLLNIIYTCVLLFGMQPASPALCAAARNLSQSHRITTASLWFCRALHYHLASCSPSRQARSSLCAVLQGNLADPLYFDFISYAQFATVSSAMESGRQEFEVHSFQLRCSGCSPIQAVSADTAPLLHAIGVAIQRGRLCGMPAPADAARHHRRSTAKTVTRGTARSSGMLSSPTTGTCREHSRHVSCSRSHLSYGPAVPAGNGVVSVGT